MKVWRFDKGLILYSKCPVDTNWRHGVNLSMADTPRYAHIALVLSPWHAKNPNVISIKKVRHGNIVECLFRANWVVTLLNHNCWHM